MYVFSYFSPCEITIDRTQTDRHFDGVHKSYIFYRFVKTRF